MNFRPFLLATAMASTSLGAAAQQSGGASSGMQMPASFETPAECKTVAGGGQMHDGMMQQMQGMMSSMSEAQKAYMEGMNKTNPLMMQGMMVKDPDVAWACSMIPHHIGAIEMSKVVLKYGDNAGIKKMAQKVIDDQGKEISELKEWLQKNANKESK